MKENQKIEIYIEDTLCKGCDICMELCKEGVFISSEHINSRGYFVPMAQNIENCNGCLICELICPEMAVTLIKVRNYEKAELPE